MPQAFCYSDRSHCCYSSGFCPLVLQRGTGQCRKRHQFLQKVVGRREEPRKAWIINSKSLCRVLPQTDCCDGKLLILTTEIRIGQMTGILRQWGGQPSLHKSSQPCAKAGHDDQRCLATSSAFNAWMSHMEKICGISLLSWVHTTCHRVDGSAWNTILDTHCSPGKALNRYTILEFYLAILLWRINNNR